MYVIYGYVIYKIKPPPHPEKKTHMYTKVSFSIILRSLNEPILIQRPFLNGL